MFSEQDVGKAPIAHGVLQVKNSVSLIVVNYNAGSLLEKCVSSALEHVGELIIVDNASHDNSLDVLPHSTRIQVIRNTTNLGFSAACNIGVVASTGQFLLFLNPDCIIQADTVTALLEGLNSDNRVGMVGGLLMNEDGSEQGGGRRAVPTPWRSLVRAFGLNRFANRWPKLFYDFHLHKQPLPEEAIEVEAISGACMLVKREAIDNVGPWDEGYFLHCEDLDWCMRFRLNGWKILFVPNARIYHALGACSRSRRVFVEWHKHKGMVRFYSKFFRHQYPGALMWLVTLGVWLRFGLAATYLTVRRLLEGLGLIRG